MKHLSVFIALFVLALTLSLGLAAQTTPSAAVSTKCHKRLTELQGKDENYFAAKTDEELAELVSERFGVNTVSLLGSS